MIRSSSQALISVPSWACCRFSSSGARPIHGPVQSYGLHVQGIDEAPEQRLPFIGELGAVGRDLIDEGIEDRFQARQRLVAIPDGARIGLAFRRGASEAFEVLAEYGGRRDGLSVFECIHDVLLKRVMNEPRRILPT